ncbi:hypothetical protein [Naasia aerilata]|uniref:hypothetical protein n=1 Tax=Naasia aerilata TaxID=1162966 RepID=UPI002573F7FF|nr:hypothetical protein [Naasia aerilata]
MSLVVAALLGILALFSGEFGETQGRVLLTTLLTGAVGIAALCHLAVAGRPVRIVGILGLAVTAIAFLLGLILIWNSGSSDLSGLFRAFGIASILAVSFAQANLLLLLSGRRHTVLRAGLLVTLGLVALAAAMIVLPIATDGAVPGDAAGDLYWRIFGAVAILDALGTVALPILGLFLRDAVTGRVTVTLTGATADRLRRYAAARNTSPEAAVAGLVDALPDAVPDRIET